MLLLAMAFTKASLDGKPTAHSEGTMDHAIRIVWAGMPALEAEPVEQIENAEPVAALPAPQLDVELEAVPVVPVEPSDDEL